MQKTKYRGPTVRSKVPRRPKPFPPQNLHCFFSPWLLGRRQIMVVYIHPRVFIYSSCSCLKRCCYPGPAHAHQILAVLPPHTTKGSFHFPKWMNFQKTPKQGGHFRSKKNRPEHHNGLNRNTITWSWSSTAMHSKAIRFVFTDII